jgi:hypothetical protein
VRQRPASDDNTQYALSGGRINADCIDNAAGVNTSDREVNLKILLAGSVETGDLSAAERDRSEVAELRQAGSAIPCPVRVSVDRGCSRVRRGTE